MQLRQLIAVLLVAIGAGIALFAFARVATVPEVLAFAMLGIYFSPLLHGAIPSSKLGARPDFLPIPQSVHVAGRRNGTKI